MFDFCISVADKKIVFNCDSQFLDYDASESKEFSEHLCECESPDLCFNIEYGNVPQFRNKEILFSVDNSWFLCKWDGKFLLEYVDRTLPGRTERVGVIDEDLTNGTIYINHEKTEKEKELAKQLCDNMPDGMVSKREKRAEKKTGTVKKNGNKIKKKKTPLDLGRSVMAELKANFFQAFLVEYVVRKRMGFIAHCATVTKDGKTYIFMGQSGAGKSTIAELFIDICGARVYNDDRAVLNVENDKVIFYNLPWTGTLTNKCLKGQGDGSELCGIFFISHSKSNVLNKTGKIEAITKIFKNSFPVFWNKKDVNYIFSVCEKIAKTVPCYDLGFVNDKNIVNFLRDNKCVDI
ncbi:MAG: hypothetical protein PHP69_00500 [Candidatus Omnitrophica bacterium]|nr:hypothetical protein [Candidatus Omnitrophota bacterium]